MSYYDVDVYRAIEKRVRRDVRTKYPFSKGEHILVIDDGSNTAFVTVNLLKSILQTMPVQLEIKPQLPKDLEKYDKIVVPWNADDELQNFLGELFENKPDHSPKAIKLLEYVLQSEVDAYAKIKGYKGKPKEKNKILEDLEKRFPGGKFALLKSKELIKS